MRIDKFINVVNITKRRAVASDMLKEGVVRLNGVKPKPAKEVKIGDKIDIIYLDEIESLEVLSLPTTKSTPKSKQNEFVKKLGS